MLFESVLAVVGIGLVGVLIARRVNATVSLFIGGLLIMLVAPLLGHVGTGAYKLAAVSNPWLGQFNYIAAILAKTTAGVGMVIMVLFGFSAYMSKIGANQAVVTLLTRPLLKLKLKYLLVPLTFWIGNLMSLAVPSASSLALILMATLYPAMVGAGLSPLTSAAVIATTATIMPTPLGADNVIAAQRLGMSLDHYVFSLHASISIPTLIGIGVVHYFWQKFMDARAEKALLKRGSQEKLAQMTREHSEKSAALASAKEDDKEPEAPLFYAIFPILPLLLILVPFIIRQFMPLDFKPGLIPVTLFSFLLAVVVELLRKRSLSNNLNEMMVFFKGMGTGFGSVVMLVVSANILVEGIVQIGIIHSLTSAVEGIRGAALLLFLAFSGLMLVLALLTGGVSPFYSLVEIAPKVAVTSGFNGALLTLPLQFIGNLARACTPVSAVVLIVSSAIKESPLRLIQRTVVPMGFGVLMSMVLTWFIVGV